MLCQDSLALPEREAVLAACELLSSAPVELLRELAASATECTYRRGEFVYGRTEVAQDLFFLLDGRIAYPEFIGWIKDDSGDVQIAQRRGQVFGFAGALMGYARRAVSALCEGPTRVLRLSGAALARACGAHRRTDILEKLVQAHVRYERLRPPAGWQRLTAEPWRLSNAPLRECVAPVQGGGVCAVVVSADAHACWRAVGGITRAAPIGAQDALQTSDRLWVDAVLEGRRGGRMRNALRGILHQFQLHKDRQPLGAAEPLQWQILEAFCSGTAHVLLRQHLAGLRNAERTRLIEFVRHVGRCFSGTVFVGVENVDQALSIGDRVVLPGADPANEFCVAIDLLPRERRAAARRVPQRPDATSPGLARAPVLAPPAALGGAVATPVRNRLWDNLQSGTFFWTVEFIPSQTKPLRGELERLVGIAGEMAGEPLAGFSVTDRVHSDHDPDPISTGLHIRETCHLQPLVHLSGKGREVSEFSQALCRLDAAGIENVLLLSGDRLKQESVGGRARYLESVCAIQTARRAVPGLRIGAALNPFKYCEDDAMAQYLKLGKKVAAGADFIITQLGYDMAKYDEALAWMEFRGYRVPVIANLMLLSAARARWIRKQRVPGIVVSDALMQLLEEDERTLPDKGLGRAQARLAMQIVGLRLRGYAGVQLTGVHERAQLQRLEREVEEDERECRDLAQWEVRWRALLTSETGRQANPAPESDPWYWRGVSIAPRRGSGTRYRLMERIHRGAFQHGPVAGTLRSLLGALRPNGPASRLVKWVESGIKGPVFGCQSCGMCRLAATQYVCPEGCPKGLANGPCGGTDGNRCEFGDRECIHSRKYRIARDAGVLKQLETWIIPPVPERRRNSASWPAHFSGEGPRIEVLDAIRQRPPAVSRPD